mgnify:CR=1 FL=1
MPIPAQAIVILWRIGMTGISVGVGIVVPRLLIVMLYFLSSSEEPKKSISEHDLFNTVVNLGDFPYQESADTLYYVASILPEHLTKVFKDALDSLEHLRNNGIIPNRIPNRFILKRRLKSVNKEERMLAAFSLGCKINQRSADILLKRIRSGAETDIAVLKASRSSLAFLKKNGIILNS